MSRVLPQTGEAEKGAVHDRYLRVRPGAVRRCGGGGRSGSSGGGSARAASDAALADNAFGMMCSPLCVPMHALVKTAADAMMDAAKSNIPRSATNLRSATAGLESADEGSASGARMISGSLASSFHRRGVEGGVKVSLRLE